ncbi:hypothetical protein TIFTF001_017775 [Ficus carica]|uniref:Uncharacterized protein n=1 Tax=Ficus carica TaxID=3494 RepID=A0AA88DA45_FICCA|nr:hypothetical protein TIFTF001_017775 [Ficus carica]
MYPRRKKQVVGEMKNADRYWQDHYFFMHVNEKSMRGLANAFYPLWGSLRIAKRVPHWVDRPFVFRGALRRFFGTPLLIEPLTDEEALIADFALDTLVMEFPNPKDLLAKRKAANEAEKAAVAAAVSENAKGNEPAPFPILESSPELPAKPVSPPAKKRKAFKKAKKGFGEEEQEIEGTVNTSHINVRAMGLFYRTTDKVAEQKTRIKELEDRDNECAHKLLDIERKFGDVKMNAEGLTAELQKAIIKSAAPAEGAMPASNEQGPIGVKPPVDVNLSEDCEMQK